MFLSAVPFCHDAGGLLRPSSILLKRKTLTFFAPSDRLSQTRLTLSHIHALFLSHNKSFVLAAFSSALVSVNRGPHNSNKCTIDPNESYSVWLTAARASPLLLCHTQIEPAWWITQWIIMDYKTGAHIKNTNTVWLGRINRHWLTRCRGSLQGEVMFFGLRSAWRSPSSVLFVQHKLCASHFVLWWKQSEMFDSKSVAMVTLYIPLLSPLHRSCSRSVHNGWREFVSWLT